MLNDKRKALRRPLRYSAWMALDNDKLHSCVLSDVSETGARLDVKDPSAVPDQFVLLLSGSGSARRNCRVVWRTPTHVGVAFAKRLTDMTDVRTAPKAEVEANTETTKDAAEPAKPVEPAESA